MPITLKTFDRTYTDKMMFLDVLLDVLSQIYFISLVITIATITYIVNTGLTVDLYIKPEISGS